MLRLHPITGALPGLDGEPQPTRTQWNKHHGEFGWTRTGGDGSAKEHKGIDYAVPAGTPVYAAHDGVVSTQFGLEQGRGKGYGRRFYLVADGVMTLYAHLSAVFVEPGQEVRAGWCVGLTGRTGNMGFDLRTPDHLHFGVKVRGNWMDPNHWLRDNSDD